MRAFVTGASGFIGRHLAHHLRGQGIDVTGLVRSTSSRGALQQLGVRLVEGDLRHPDGIESSLAGHDWVFHLAGLTASLRHEELERVNGEGTRALLELAARVSKPPVVVVISSLAAAGPAVGRPLRESDPPQPLSWYGRSKRSAEKAAEAKAAELPVTIVRPPIVFGENDRATLPMFRTIHRFGIHAIPGLTPKWFSLIHVEDLSDLLLRAAMRGERLAAPAASTTAGQGFYFADSGVHLRYGEIGLLIGEAMGRRVLRVPIPHWGVWTVGAISEWVGRRMGRAASMSTDKAREATAGSWTCSGDKAAEQLGFQVTVPLVDRLRQTADWYRDQKWL